MRTHTHSHTHAHREAFRPFFLSYCSNIQFGFSAGLRFSLTCASLSWRDSLTFNPVSSTLNSVPPRILIFTAEFVVIDVFSKSMYVCLCVTHNKREAVFLFFCFFYFTSVFWRFLFSLSGSLRTHRQSVCGSPQQVHVSVWRNLRGQSWSSF